MNSNDTMTQYVVELDARQQHDLEELQDTRSNKTLEEILQQVIKTGLYNMNYRTNFNRREYQAKKMQRTTIDEQKQRIAQLEAELNGR
jgi:hypothetical protein